MNQNSEESKRLAALRKIKFTAKFFDAWRIYWDALIEEAANSGISVSQKDHAAMKKLYRLARLSPQKIAAHCASTAEQVIAAEVIAALVSESSFIDAVQGTVDAAVVLGVDAFIDAAPTLETIGIDANALEQAPVLTLLEALPEFQAAAGEELVH